MRKRPWPGFNHVRLWFEGFKLKTVYLFPLFLHFPVETSLRWKEVSRLRSVSFLAVHQVVPGHLSRRNSLRSKKDSTYQFFLSPRRNTESGEIPRTRHPRVVVVPTTPNIFCGLCGVRRREMFNVRYQTLLRSVYFSILVSVSNNVDRPLVLLFETLFRFSVGSQLVNNFFWTTRLPN
jgi:hypothetical protein